MGILTGLAAAGVWLILWLIAWASMGMSPAVGMIGLAAGLLASFAVGVRLGHPRWRTDPVSRVEQRQQARQRFEARTRRMETEDRQSRLAREDREADERAEARVRALLERRGTNRGTDGDDDAVADGGPSGR